MIRVIADLTVGTLSLWVPCVACKKKLLHCLVHYYIIVQDFLVVTQFSEYVMAVFKQNIEHRISTPMPRVYTQKSQKSPPIIIRILL